MSPEVKEQEQLALAETVTALPAEVLAQFGEFQPEQLERLQNLFENDHPMKEYSPEEQELARANRLEFFETLGLGDPAAKFLEFRPSMIPLATFISAQEVFLESNLDAAKVIHAFPAAISHTPEGVRAKVENMQALGLDAAKIVNTFPAAIGYAPEGVRAKLENMEALGLDATKVINAHPTAIGYAPEGVRAKLENMEALGLDATKVINAHPTAIGYAPEGIRIKFYTLMRHGLINENTPFDCDNKSLIKKLLILPNESLLLYLGSQRYQEESPAIEQVPAKASRHAKSQGAPDAAKRRELFDQRLRKLTKTSGYVAIMNAIRLKTDPEVIKAATAD